MRAPLLAAGTLAVLAQTAFGLGRTALGAALGLLAAIAFGWGGRAFAPADLVGETPPAEPASARRGGRLLGGALLLLAVAAGVVALRGLRPEVPTGGPWLLHLASLVLFVPAARLLGGAPAVSPPRPSARVLLALGAILAVAAGLRLYQLDALPFGSWWDEANNGLSARAFLERPRERPVFLGSTQLPAHFFYVVELAFRLFGDGPVAIRLVTVAFGLGTVLLAFLAGREALGDRFGLLFAAVTAASRWNLTFSRIGLVAIPAPFFVLLSLLFLFRGVRRRSPAEFGFAGLSIGLGLSFYFAFRLFLPVLGLFLLVWAAALFLRRAEAPRGLRRAGLSLALLFAGGALSHAPVVQYAFQRPDVFFARTTEVSIFNRRDEPDLTKALVSQTAKHLLMFNGPGDRNGRHNLPGAPMLDPATGVLFLLGLGLATALVVRPKGALSRPATLAFAALFPVGLLGGILSLDFEAPQSVRSIVAMPAVLAFAALAAEALLRAVEGDPPARRRVAASLAGLLAAGLAVWNGWTYFGPQARHDGAWAEHSAVETLAAKKILEVGPSKATFYLPQYLHNHVVIRFLAPKLLDSVLLMPHEGFPLAADAGRPAVVLVDPNSGWALDEVRRYYPNAAVTADLSPSGRPFLETAVISAADLGALQGLDATREGGRTELRGVLLVPVFGRYELSLEGDGRLGLDLDGREVLAGPSGATTKRLLAKGLHAMTLRATGAGAAPRLFWRVPTEDRPEPAGAREEVPARHLFRASRVAARGLLGRFWAGVPKTEGLAFARVDPALDTYFHYTPLPRPYTAEWSGTLHVPTSGTYELSFEIHGAATLFLDGREAFSVDEKGRLPEPVSLEAGPHPIRIVFLDTLGGSRLHFFWKPPGHERMVVPAAVLSPDALGEEP